MSKPSKSKFILIIQTHQDVILSVGSPFPHRWWAARTSKSDRTRASPALPSGCEAYSGLAQRGPASGPFRCAGTGRAPHGSLRSTGRGRNTCSCTGSGRCSAGTPAERGGWRLRYLTDTLKFLPSCWNLNMSTQLPGPKYQHVTDISSRSLVIVLYVVVNLAELAALEVALPAAVIWCSFFF